MKLGGATLTRDGAEARCRYLPGWGQQHRTSTRPEVATAAPVAPGIGGKMTEKAIRSVKFTLDASHFRNNSLACDGASRNPGVTQPKNQLFRKNVSL